MLKTNNQVQESVTGINNGIDNPTFQNEENYNFVKENAVKTTADEANELNKEKRRIWKSLACLFLTVMLSYSSSITLYNSLTSLFPNDNFGISVLSILASSQVVGAASASVCLKIWGCLKMLRIGLLTGVVFIIAFFYPTWITLTIGGIAAGFSFAMIYAAGYTYANSVGYWLAHITNNGNSLDAILVRVTGIMNASQMGGFIWGNLFLYYIFGSSPKVDVRSSEELCGAAYCNQELNVTTLQPPSPHSYYTLIGILTAMSVTACATSYFLEDFSSRLGHKCRSIKEICTVFLDFLRLFKNPKGFLLAPLTIAISMEESFLLGDATIGLISCSLGISMVGLIVMAYGVTEVMVSFVYWPIVQKFGRLFTVGSAIWFAWSPFVCVDIKFYFVAVVFVISFALYLFALRRPKPEIRSLS